MARMSRKMLIMSLIVCADVEDCELEGGGVGLLMSCELTPVS